MNLLNNRKNKNQIVIKQKAKNSFFNELKKNYCLFIMTIPGLTLFFLLCYLPISGIFIAFVDYKNYVNNFYLNIIKSKWVGLNNFTIFLNDRNFIYALRNTISYQLIFIFAGTLMSLLIALLLNEIKNRYVARFYQSCMLLPYFLSWTVFSYVVFSFLSVQNGVINRMLLEPLGAGTVSWYMESKYWPYILFIVNTLKYAGYGSIIYLAAIVGIDPEYYEAAIIDGASRWQQVTKVTIPLISNVIIIMLVINLGHILSADFGLFYNIPLQSEFILEKTNVIDMYIYRVFQGRSGGTTNTLVISTAAGLFKSLIGFITVMVTNLVVKKIDSEKSLF